MIDYILNIFNKPYYQITFLDSLVYLVILLAIYFLIYGIYKLINYIKDRSK